MQTTGVIARTNFSEGIVVISLKVKRKILGQISDDVAVTPQIAGWSKLSTTKAGDPIKVEVELIPPRTSTLTHLNVTKIIGIKRGGSRNNG